jgi:hypothetical protein
MKKLMNIHAVHRPHYGNPGIASTLLTSRPAGEMARGRHPLVCKWTIAPKNGRLACSWSMLP